MSDFLSTLRTRLQARIAERQAAKAAMDELLEAPARFKRDLNSTEAARFAEARAKVAGLDAEIAGIEARIDELAAMEARRTEAAALHSHAPVITSEAHTYNERSAADGVSFFADAFASQFRGDYKAGERLARHGREVEVERRDITTGTMNGLVPPLYLLDAAAEVARAMRPFANVLPRMTLPPAGMSITVTRGTTGTATAAQTSQNTAAVETDYVSTDLVIPVVTIMGQQDVSRQLFERSSSTMPADALIMRDLIADYHTRLDALTLSGTGSDGQHLGILNVSGVSTESWTGTTVASFYAAVASAANKVNVNRYAPASVIVMHPRRWHWLLSKSDSEGRPLVQPTANVSANPVGVGGTGYGPVGTMLGLPVIIDANVPTNLGSSTNEDRVIVTRVEDSVLWEGPSSPLSFYFDSTTNAPATIRLAVAGYSAFTAGRYPASTCIVQGTGLAGTTFG